MSRKIKFFKKKKLTKTEIFPRSKLLPMSFSFVVVAWSFQFAASWIMKMSQVSLNSWVMIYGRSCAKSFCEKFTAA